MKAPLTEPDYSAPTPTAAQAAQTAVVAQIVAQAIASAPLVVNAPANTMPSVAQIQSVAQQVAAAIAPVVAPQVSPAAVQQIIQTTAQAVADNPQAKAADIGQTIAPDAIQKIADSVTNTVINNPAPDVTQEPLQILNNPFPAQTTQPGEQGFVGPTAVPDVTPEPRSKTTPDERARESGQLYGSENAGITTPEVTGPTGPTGSTGTNSSTGPTGPAVTVTDPTTLLDAANKQAERVSAFNILKDEFNKYGLGSLVDNIKGLLTDGTPASEFALKLRETPAYQQRFVANTDRIKAGLSALSPAEYVALEDQYQNIMRNYGLPSSYYGETTDATTGVKRQVGFDKLIAGDVSAAELENRVATAQQRVLNTNPEVLTALKQFYPDISNADILAYTLDPKNGLDAINRKVTAAEIGGAALQQGLQANGGTAESLAGQGITKAQAQQGYANVAEVLPRGSQLADIYGQIPYTQGTAEAEVFNTTGAAQAKEKRKKLTALEQASFSGSSGVGGLSRDRALSPYMQGQPGAGAY